MSTAFRSRRPGCLVAIGAALVLVAGGALLVRRALDPESLRSAAEAQLTEFLGQPVTIGRMTVSLFPTPSVEGGDISVGRGAGTAPSLGLGGIRVRPQLSAIFSKPIVVERVEIDGLVLNVRRDENGRWHLPFPGVPAGAPPSGEGPIPARSPSGSGEAPETIEVRQILLTGGRLIITDDVLRSPSGSAEVASLDGIAAIVSREGGVTRLDSLTSALGGTTITGTGTASRDGLTLKLAWSALRAEELPQVFALIGTAAPAGLAVEGDHRLALDLSVDAAGALTASGTLAASRVTLDTFTLTTLEAPLALARHVLTLDPVTFDAYGGSQRGRLTANLASTPVSWTLESRVAGLDVGRALSATTSATDRLSGTGRLIVNLRGAAVAPLMGSLAGTVDAALASGVIRNFPLLASINTALRISESAGSDTTFESLSATLHVAGGRATTNNLRLAAGELSVAAAGTLTFDQVLSFTGRAIFSRAKSQELIASVRELSGLKNTQGEIEVPLTIRGTVSQPEVQIDAGRILTGAIQKEMKRQLDRGLRRFIR
jgi:uncharacterized protein involved in outer membrane biogenesis